MTAPARALPDAPPRPPRYVPAPLFLLRVPLLPLTVPPGGQGDGPAGEVDALLEAAADERVRLALAIASPSASDAIELLLRGASGSPRRAERATSTLYRYLSRMSARPTPYGLFAGVAVGRFGSSTDLCLAADPVGATRTRADVSWVLSLIRALEEDPALRRSCTLRWNPAAYPVGDRLVLPFADVDGTRDDRHITVALTRPVQVVLELLSDGPATWQQAADAVHRALPQARPEQVGGLLDQLWDVHLLTSDLRPSLGTGRPEDRLLAGLAGDPRQVPLSEGLVALRRLTDELDATRGRAGVDAWRGLVAHQRALVPDHAGDTLQVDTRLALDGARVHERVAHDVADLATVLARLGAARPRPRHLVDYHAVFVEKFGIGAELPVTEVLSPETGLDAPGTYTRPVRAFPLPATGAQDDGPATGLLSALLVETVVTGADHLELTDAVLDRLAGEAPGGHGGHGGHGGDGAPRPHRPSLDVHVQVAARSARDLDEGRYELVLAPGVVTDGLRTFGRFADLFDAATVDAMRDVVAAEEALAPTVLFAELDYIPTEGRSANVSLHPVLRGTEMCIGTSPSLPRDQQLLVGDVLVGADADGLYLRDARTGRELVVTQSHLLTSTAAPNLCRFLLEVSEERWAALGWFDWGPLASAPYLPAVRRGRTLLSPATWRVTARALGVAAVPGDRPDDPEEVERCVAAWRRRYRLPRHVYCTWADNRVLLDLDTALGRRELLDEVRRDARAGRPSGVLLQEMAPGPDDLWVRDAQDRPYVAELVVPVLLDGGTGPAAPSQADRVAVPPLRRSAVGLPAARRHLPGEQWTHLKLYVPPHDQDEVLLGPFSDLLAEVQERGLCSDWFFVRYADPFPHLRLRLRAAGPAAEDELLVRVGRWGRGLATAARASDVVLASYDRELERYGGAALMPAVEQVFRRDSELALALLPLTRGPDLPPAAWGALSVHALAAGWSRSRTGASPQPAQARRQGPPLDGVADGSRTLFRSCRRTLLDLLQPWPAHPDPVATRLRPLVLPALAARAAAVAAAAARAEDLDRTGQLAGNQERIVGSLAHMAVNRLLGMDRDTERTADDLAALAAHGLAQRPDERTGGTA